MEKEYTSEELIAFMENKQLTRAQKVAFAKKLNLIEDFEPELMERLKDCFFAGSSAYIFLVMENKTGIGKCWDKSVALTLAMDDFNLVTGNLKSMEEAYGKGHDWHYWVEQGDTVYDATTLSKYKKWFYYYLDGVSDVKQRTNKELFSEDWYMQMREHGAEDFLRFYYLNMPLIESIAHSQGNQLMIDEIERLKKVYGKNVTGFNFR